MPRMLKSMETMRLDEFATCVNSGMYGGGAYASQRSTIGMLVAGASMNAWMEMKERQGDPYLVYRGDVVVYQEKFLEKLREIIAMHNIHHEQLQDFRKAGGKHMQEVWRHFRTHTQVPRTLPESTTSSIPREAA